MRDRALIGMKDRNRKSAKLPPPRNPYALDAKSRNAGGPMAHRMDRRMKTRGDKRRAAFQDQGF